MWDFLLVLGQIPGTNIQITFNEMLYTAVLAIIGYMAFRQRLQFQHDMAMANKSFKRQAKSAKKSLKIRQRSYTKLLASFKRKAKSRTKSLRSLPANKVHARQRAA